VRLVAIRARFLREERGFTLPEMLVTIIIMMVVFFALYSVFDMSVRIFSFGSNKVEAVESARLGLERMERELRAAYPVGTDGHLFFSTNSILPTSNPPKAMPTVDRITFGNELGAEGQGDGTIDCPAANDCEYITYKLTDDANGSTAQCTDSPCDLRRVNTSNPAAPGAPVVDNAVFPGGLQFAYLKSDGTPVTGVSTTNPPCEGGAVLSTDPVCEGEIDKVRISLEILVHPGTQTEARQRLTTEIDLRNRQ
jgi:prepilin-type N-terminal cleavage/methylation domain-containing protein